MTNPSHLEYRRWLPFIIIALLMWPAPRAAHAQSLSALDAIGQSPDDWRRFLLPATPPHLDVSLFTGGIEAGGFSPERYQVIVEGVEAEQSITRGLSLVGRATGIELWTHGNFSNPLQPSTTGKARLNFARLQGGIRLKPIKDLEVTILGGRDAGDSSAAVIEGDIRYSMLTRSEHPTSVSATTVHDYENGITSSEIDFRSMLFIGNSLAIYVGPGGQLYGGGIIPHLQGQGGAIVGAMLRRYNLGIELQSGYGNAGEYTQLSIFKGFSVRE